MAMIKDIDKYKEYLEFELNYSKNTIMSYEKDLNDFNKFLISNNLNYIKLVKKDIRSYLKLLDDNKNSNKTIARKLTSLRMFFEFLLEVGAVNNNVFSSVENPKIEKNLPHYLNYNEIEELISSMEEDDAYHIRNKLIIEILYSTGIRLNELTNLKTSDINYSNKIIRVLGKGSKEREVFYGDKLSKILELYLKKARDELLKDKKSDYLLISKLGSKLSSNSIYKIVRDSINYISSKRKISPHTLRHTFATHLINNGATIKSVQTLLGHESINTTEIYTHVSNKVIKDVYLKTHPRKELDDE